MRTIDLFVAVAFFAAGCASQQPKEEPKAPVETPRAAQEAPKKVEPQPATKPVQSSPVAVNPLDDPRSLLSKRSIYYDFDKSDIKGEYKPLVQAHAGYLTGHRGAKVRIEGNCDERGSREYNLALGQRRADSVKTAMKLLGATDGQIDTVSWGEEKPKASGHDEAAWAENRRSDIVYEKTQ